MHSCICICAHAYLLIHVFEHEHLWYVVHVLASTKFAHRDLCFDLGACFQSESSNRWIIFKQYAAFSVCFNLAGLYPMEVIIFGYTFG